MELAVVNIAPNKWEVICAWPLTVFHPLSSEFCQDSDGRVSCCQTVPWASPPDSIRSIAWRTCMRTSNSGSPATSAKALSALWFPCSKRKRAARQRTSLFVSFSVRTMGSIARGSPRSVRASPAVRRTARPPSSGLPHLGQRDGPAVKYLPHHDPGVVGGLANGTVLEGQDLQHL